MNGKILENTKKYEGVIFDVEHQLIKTPHDLTIEREIVTHAPVVVILAINEKDEIIVTNEYRAGVNKVTLGLPAGFIDKGEVPCEAAKREFTEETGYLSQSCVEMMKVNSSEGFTDETAYLYLIHFNSNNMTDINFDDDEYLETKLINKKQVKKMLLENEFESAQVVSALSFYFLQNL